MARPVVTVTLYYPTSQTLVLTPFLTQEGGSEITDALELPDASNSFVAAEVQLQGRDGYTSAGSPVTTLLLNIPVDSTDYRVKIVKDGEQIFSGFIVPESVQVDARAHTFGFQCIGLSGLLARTDASTLERRIPTPYTGLVLAEDKGTLFAELIVCLGSWHRQRPPIRSSSIPATSSR